MAVVLSEKNKEPPPTHMCKREGVVVVAVGQKKRTPLLMFAAREGVAVTVVS